MFEVDCLIFAFKNGQSGWYKSSDCLWSGTTEIRGKVTLNHDYEQLEAFFLDTLKVKKLTLGMVYGELRDVQPQQSVDEIKKIIWSFNALLQTELSQLDPEQLLKSCIFSVRYPNGQTRLRSAVDTEFAIIDRDYLAERFRDCIKLLDHNLEEVRRLKPFLSWVTA